MAFGKRLLDTASFALIQVYEFKEFILEEFELGESTTFWA